MAQDRDRAEESSRHHRDPGHKPGVLDWCAPERAAVRRAGGAMLGADAGRPGSAVADPHDGGGAAGLCSMRRRAVLRAAAALAAMRPDRRPLAQEGGRVAIEDAWARPAIEHDNKAAIFLRLRNPGPGPARLAAAETPAAARVEFEETVMEFGVPHPRPHSGPVVVPPGGVVSFEPGGLRLALVRPAADLVQTGRVPLTLRFADGSTRTITVPVRAIGAEKTIGEQDGHVPH